MSYFTETVVIIMGILVILALEFSPLIVAAVTGNWWYMFLFLVSWIPTAVVIMILRGIID